MRASAQDRPKNCARARLLGTIKWKRLRFASDKPKWKCPCVLVESNTMLWVDSTVNSLRLFGVVDPQFFKALSS